MSSHASAIENLTAAQKHGMNLRPKVGGFPYLAEALRRAGVSRNVWSLPSCQSLYLTALGPVMQQGTPLVAAGTHAVPEFNRDALIKALRTDQEGRGTFAEFLASSWKAGVVGYAVDFEARNVTYFGARGETYLEDYPEVQLPD